ncbi:MAG TPA: TonB-dependent receptor [Bryobacteraceae bacterium]
MLTGDLTTYTSAACQGGKPVTLKAPYVNNQLPPSLLSPVALKMMTYYPPTTDPCGKEYYATVQNQDEHMGIARGDYQLTSKQSLFLRYFVTHSLQPTPFNGTNPLTETLSGADDMVNSGVFGHTYAISANIVNSFRATYNRSGVTKTQIPSFDGPDLGIDMTTLVPGHVVISAGTLSSAAIVSYAAKDPTDDHQLSDDLSWVKGKHQLTFGANWIREVQNVYGPLEGDGFFSFTGQTTGLALSDFLVGDVASFTQQGIQYDDERYQYFGAYAQDTWKATQHLTVNYGLRWEPYIGGSMAHGYVSHFDPGLFAAGVHSTVYPNGPAGVLYPGDSGFNTNDRPSHTKLDNFAPRIGVVWDPKGDGRMSIRASWGIFYDMPHTLFSYGFSEEPPWGDSITRTGVSFQNPWAGFPGGNPFPLQLNKNAYFPIPGTYTTYPLNIKNTYMEQWNFSIQKQVGANWLLSASYLGNDTIHLWADDPVNAAVYIPGVSTLATENQHRVLYLQNPAQGQYFGTIHSLDDGSTAEYDALLISANHRLSSHFTVLGNYTWSHCISGPFTSELDGTQYTDPYDRAFDRGNCGGIDRRHLINFSAVEEAPRFSNAWMRALASDWKLSEILQIQAGSYITVGAGTDVDLTGIGGQRASYNGAPTGASGNCSTGPACLNWLNPAAFVAPATGTLGNLGPANILGPGTFNINAALVRAFPVRETKRIEIRAEAFNLLNHIQPTNPGATVSSPATFGQITTFGNPRIMQFAGKFVF